jgi:hypothetical protein
MKQFLLALLLSISAFNLFAQQKHLSTDSIAFRNYTNDVDNKRQALARQKQYRSIDTILNQWVRRFNALPGNVKPGFKRSEATMYYNLACYNALLNNKTAALVSLEKSAKTGFSNYQGTIYDSDLESLRHEKQYLSALQIIWQNSEVGHKLRSSAAYDHKLDKSLPAFTYQSAASPVLVNFKNKFNLDSVAGNGGEISRIKNLLLWVHNTVRHDGLAGANPAKRNGLDLIELCKKEKLAVNCRMLATIMKDVYLAEGFQARVVTCLPKDTADNDCHVINVVWSRTLNKWLWMDPVYNGYIADNRGALLSIEEVRDKLHHDQLNSLILNSDANWGNEIKTRQDWYLGFYMSKNLYTLQCSANSEWDLETAKSDKPVVAYIYLYPRGYNLVKAQNAITNIKTVKYGTNSPAYFWQKPNLN